MSGPLRLHGPRHSFHRGLRETGQGQGKGLPGGTPSAVFNDRLRSCSSDGLDRGPVQAGRGAVGDDQGRPPFPGRSRVFPRAVAGSFPGAGRHDKHDGDDSTCRGRPHPGHDPTLTDTTHEITGPSPGIKNHYKSIVPAWQPCSGPGGPGRGQGGGRKIDE